MTNKEYYNDKIIEIACREECTIAFNNKTNEMVACNDLLYCSCCKFANQGNCREALSKWLDEEYKEPSVNWSKVAVDTKILVKNSEDDKWYKRYFAKYEDGKVYTFFNGRTSWSVKDGDYYVCDWEYAKLYNERGDN